MLVLPCVSIVAPPESSWRVNAPLVLRRLRAAVAELPDGYAELPRLVGEVLLNAGAGKYQDADRQHVEHLIIALEGGGLGVLGPVGLKGDLRNLAMIGPTGGNPLGTLWRSAMQQDHVGMLGADPIEHVPD